MNLFTTNNIDVKKDGVLKEGTLSKQSRMLKSWRE